MEGKVKNTYQFFSYFGKFEFEVSTRQEAIAYAKAILEQHPDAQSPVVFLPNSPTYIYLNEFYQYYH